ncbi:MAG TPA: hypothetical protein VFO53_08705 [Casimicrobiaceae bacterium]|nr:hypothetical protein [Casimicrobiaceae bacterium]
MHGAVPPPKRSSMSSGSACAIDHLPDSQQRVYHNQCNPRMCVRKHSKRFIGKRLSNALDSGEVEYDRLETIDARKHPPGLRARHELVVAVPGKSDRDDCFGESVIIGLGARVPVDYFALRSDSIVLDPHVYGRSGVWRTQGVDPVFRLADLVAEIYGVRYDPEFVYKERDRVGGGVTSAALPHHRTCGSAYGGS